MAGPITRPSQPAVVIVAAVLAYLTAAGYGGMGLLYAVSTLIPPFPGGAQVAFIVMTIYLFTVAALSLIGGIRLQLGAGTRALTAVPIVVFVAMFAACTLGVVSGRWTSRSYWPANPVLMVILILVDSQLILLIWTGVIAYLAGRAESARWFDERSRWRYYELRSARGTLPLAGDTMLPAATVVRPREATAGFAVQAATPWGAPVPNVRASVTSTAVMPVAVPGTAVSGTTVPGTPGPVVSAAPAATTPDAASITAAVDSQQDAVVGNALQAYGQRVLAGLDPWIEETAPLEPIRGVPSSAVNANATARLTNDIIRLAGTNPWYAIGAWRLLDEYGMPQWRGTSLPGRFLDALAMVLADPSAPPVLYRLSDMEADLVRRRGEPANSPLWTIMPDSHRYGGKTTVPRQSRPG
jgi:hypothetical protein